MKIAVVGIRVCRSRAGCVPGRKRQRRSRASTRTRRKSRRSRRGKMPIYEPGLEEMVRRNQHEDRLTLHDRSAGARCAPPRSSSSPSARRRARTAPPICSTCSPSRATIGQAMDKYTVVVDKSTVPVGTAEKVRDDDRRRDHAAVQRRQQPGVPEAGRGDRRLHEARSRRHRRRGRRRARRDADEGALRARSRAPARRS